MDGPSNKVIVVGGRGAYNIRLVVHGKKFTHGSGGYGYDLDTAMKLAQNIASEIRDCTIELIEEK